MNSTAILVQAGKIAAYPLVIHLLAILTWPLCRLVFGSLPDKGYALARPFALAVCGFSAWLLFSMDLIPNSVAGFLTVLLILFITSWWAIRHNHHRFFNFSELRWSYRIVTNALFYFVFAAWIFVRWCDPQVLHTEQPMDLMMLTSLWNNTTYPVEDLWLAGYPISYYYFGYWLQHFPARLAECPPVLTCNIGQACWLAMLFSGCFSLGCNALAGSGKKRLMIFAGGLCAGGVLCLSNVSGTLSAVAGDGASWWWWSASRTVHDGAVELITEFPFFSFLLGDNHPHLLALPLLMLFTACSLNLICSSARMPATPNGSTNRSASGDPVLFPSLIAMSVITGLLYMTNAWNVPLALLLAILTVLITNSSWKKKIALCTGYALLTASTLSLLLLPYHLTAQNQLDGIALFHAFHTDPLELILMFGYFIPGCLLLLFLTLRKTKASGSLNIPTKFGLICLAAGLTAILIPEILYFRDVFNNRMNTVFKFYYQGWFFLALASACGLSETLPIRRLRFLLIPILLFLSTGLVYPGKALRDITNALTPSPLGIHALGWFEKDAPDEAAALRWLKENTHSGERILVPEGISYEPRSVMCSLYAERPMLLGWSGHEHQWRGSAFSEMAGTRVRFLESLFARDTDTPLPCGAPEWDAIRFMLINRNEHESRMIALTQTCPGITLVSVYSNQTIRIYEKK